MYETSVPNPVQCIRKMRATYLVPNSRMICVIHIEQKIWTSIQERNLLSAIDLRKFFNKIRSWLWSLCIIRFLIWTIEKRSYACSSKIEFIESWYVWSSIDSGYRLLDVIHVRVLKWGYQILVGNQIPFLLIEDMFFFSLYC